MSLHKSPSANVPSSKSPSASVVPPKFSKNSSNRLKVGIPKDFFDMENTNPKEFFDFDHWKAAPLLVKNPKNGLFFVRYFGCIPEI
jgi:hypothetical protein